MIRVSAVLGFQAVSFASVGTVFLMLIGNVIALVFINKDKNIEGDANKIRKQIKDLKINELLNRIKNNEIYEIILAFNPDLTGETTIMFLRQKINIFNPNLKITRLARGLPVGSDLQYADEITLEGAIKNRTEDN